MEKINETQEFKNYEEMTRKSEAFGRGVKDFKEKNVRTAGIEPLWVKRLVRVADWNNCYKYNSSYCFLGKGAEKGVWMGFLETGYIPQSCEELDDNELRIVDEYRRMRSIRPYPLKGVVTSQ